MKLFSVCAVIIVCVIMPVRAQHESEDLAKKLQNPIAHLISVPIQYNYDRDIGPNDDGSLRQTNIQPVYPFRLNEDWHLISRTSLGKRPVRLGSCKQSWADLNRALSRRVLLDIACLSQEHHVLRVPRGTRLNLQDITSRSDLHGGSIPSIPLQIVGSR